MVFTLFKYKYLIPSKHYKLSSLIFSTEYGTSMVEFLAGQTESKLCNVKLPKEIPKKVKIKK